MSASNFADGTTVAYLLLERSVLRVGPFRPFDKLDENFLQIRLSRGDADQVQPGPARPINQVEDREIGADRTGENRMAVLLACGKAGQHLSSPPV